MMLVLMTPLAHSPHLSCLDHPPNSATAKYSVAPSATTTATSAPAPTAASTHFALPDLPYPFLAAAAIANTRQPKIKLKLDTSGPVCARTFGKGSRSLRLDALSTTSPTSRNTWRNANDPSPLQAQHPSLSLPLPLPSPGTAHTPTTASNTVSNQQIPPYSPPVAASCPDLPASKPSSSPAMGKKVSFRSPLAEVIVTTKYQMSNADILALDLALDLADESTAAPSPSLMRSRRREFFPRTSVPKLQTEMSQYADQSEELQLVESPVSLSSPKKELASWPRPTTKRDSDSSESSDGGEENDATCTETVGEASAIGRRKRRCSASRTSDPL